MIRTSMMIRRTAAWIACLFLGLGAAAQADTVVYSNTAGGDTLVGPTSNTAIGSSGWYYSDVRIGATVGISSALPRSGNGSVSFQGVPGDSNEPELQGGRQFFHGAAPRLAQQPDVVQLRLVSGQLEHHGRLPIPALRCSISDGAHTPGISSSSRFTMNSAATSPPPRTMSPPTLRDRPTSGRTGTLPSTPNYYNSPLSGWQSSLTGYSVYGISSGIGSGWTDGTFVGGVDNINIGFTVDGSRRHDLQLRGQGRRPRAGQHGQPLDRRRDSAWPARPTAAVGLAEPTVVDSIVRQNSKGDRIVHRDGFGRLGLRASGLPNPFSQCTFVRSADPHTSG